MTAMLNNNNKQLKNMVDTFEITAGLILTFINMLMLYLYSGIGVG